MHPTLYPGPDLTAYDFILVNTSGGKDSQAMLDAVVAAATAAGVADRLRAVHADLGRVEWPGTAELAEEQADHYGVPFRKVSRPQGDLLDHIEERGMFPSSTTRYCTSDHKRGQIRKVMTALADEFRGGGGEGRCRILNCMGFRREESPARRKRDGFVIEGPASNATRRQVDEWLPIIEWTAEDVWSAIRSSGVRHHPAYDAGMPRLSCCYCVLASKSALVRAAQLAPALAAEYAAVEVRIGHRFTDKLSMADIIELAAAAPAVATVDDWAA
jgi:3'-phosphoadenosine 5'-phosphosulfate sulfotransferase (PAPS reductase)/FAD synthetase